MAMREDLCVLGGFGAGVSNVFAPMTKALGIPAAGQATKMVRIGYG